MGPGSVSSRRTPSTSTSGRVARLDAEGPGGAEAPGGAGPAAAGIGGGRGGGPEPLTGGAGARGDPAARGPAASALPADSVLRWPSSRLDTGRRLPEAP